jgi:hypothetical protein
VGLEPHTFKYSERCHKPVRLDQTSSSRLASEMYYLDMSGTSHFWKNF